MKRHPLHKFIGELIDDDAISSPFKIVKDPACGGRHNIPFFCSKKKSNKTEYCNVDLLILKNNKIKVIIEIEEANIMPTQICGKFLTSALSSYYIHKSTNNKPISMDNSVMFIQILNTSRLKKDKTSKIEQWKNINKSIQKIIPLKGSKIDSYKLFFGDVGKLDEKQSPSLVCSIKKFCNERSIIV